MPQAAAADPVMNPNITGRLALLDTLRGLILLSMVAYHALWDAVYLFGAALPWYGGEWAFFWQQSICWGFIFLSGFCWPLGRRPVRRGLTVFGAGVLVMAVTAITQPESRIVFGVLTLLGSCALLLTPLHRWLQRLPALLGLACSAGLFVLLRNVNAGYLGFGEWNLLPLPAWLYQNSFTTFLGFMQPGFKSADYFSLFPWFFLFLCGYFACLWLKEKERGFPSVFKLSVKPLAFLGRHSLLLYLLHQPALYLGLTLIWPGARFS